MKIQAGSQPAQPGTHAGYMVSVRHSSGVAESPWQLWRIRCAPAINQQLRFPCAQHMVPRRMRKKQIAPSPAYNCWWRVTPWQRKRRQADPERHAETAETLTAERQWYNQAAVAGRKSKSSISIGRTAGRIQVYVILHLQKGRQVPGMQREKSTDPERTRPRCRTAVQTQVI